MACEAADWQPVKEDLMYPRKADFMTAVWAVGFFDCRMPNLNPTAAMPAFAAERISAMGEGFFRHAYF